MKVRGALAPRAELIADPLFAEAPLAAPPIPLMKMRVPKWAVVSRVLWHAGYHPGIENYRKARARARQAADVLMEKLRDGGSAPPAVALVAHGYFNAMIGRQIAPARIFAYRGASRALLECRDLRMESRIKRTRMREQKVDVPTRDGEADSILYLPDGAGPWPGVVYLTDIWGIRPASEKMARRVAEQGYVVLLPNLFYRTHTLPIDPLLKGGQRGMDVVMPLLNALDAERMARDGVAYVEYLLGREDVKKPKVAVVGYCFSGAMAGPYRGRYTGQGRGSGFFPWWPSGYPKTQTARIP